MSDWLELELAHDLAPVRAPEGLWERIEMGAVPVRRRVMPRWPLAAVAAAAILWFVVRSVDARSIRSADAAQISAWARQRAGIALSLPASPTVQLRGARLVRANVVAVDFQVEGHAGTLLVARAGAGPDTPHGRYAWRRGGQTFTLAYDGTEHPDAACLLCHASL